MADNRGKAEIETEPEETSSDVNEPDTGRMQPAGDSAAGEAVAEEGADEGTGEGRVTLPQDPSSMLGAAVWLMIASAGHKHLFVTDFEWLLVPPILAKQIRLYRRDNVPVGFVSWAKLTDETEARIINGSVKLAPKEWTEGDKLWIIDVIAPFGGADDIITDLKKFFEGQTVKYIQADKDGRRVEVL